MRNGCLERHCSRDPLWRRVDEKQTERPRLREEIAASADLTGRFEQLARLFTLVIDGLSRDKQIFTVMRVYGCAFRSALSSRTWGSQRVRLRCYNRCVRCKT